MTRGIGLPRSCTSLIISSRERPDLLTATVYSILESEAVPAEIVLIDQSRKYNFELAGLGLVKGCNVRYCQSDTRGLSCGKNEGIRLASYDILVFTDDDMQADPGWFGAMVEALEAAGSKGVVTGRVLEGVPEKASGFASATVTSAEPAVFAGRLDRDVLAAGNMAIYRSAFDEVGGFDERLGAGARFPAAGDNDFGFRLLEAGYRILYAPDALLYHRAWRARSSYLKVRWNYGRGKGGFYLKHLRRQDLHMLNRLAADIGRRLASLPSHLLHRPGRAVGDVAYVGGILWGAARWSLSERR